MKKPSKINLEGFFLFKLNIKVANSNYQQELRFYNPKMLKYLQFYNRNLIHLL